MRLLLGVLLVAAVLAVPAGAAVDPRVFVLSQADAPRGYLFDKDNSLLMTRAMVDSAPSEKGAQALARAGFVNAYFARYTRYGPPHWSYVNSAAYAFRQPRGAESYMRWMTRTGFGKGSGPPRRIALGDEAWLYTISSSTDTGTAVLWRHGRVVAMVSCFEMTGHRSLALAQARKQQRRIFAQLS
jgi:hypothetical protein